ncbi:hypothetical protein [Pantoea phytobeneficialis]|uniref:Uncharacterized protein n=2 Tax=Pantoea phytobeneficialis TaxID=2052056 RepID=A0AAP9H5X6_9GAMM|nr:hypothetical protein [Pantoea phytobeneficialis]QGR07147.1 hypothetical protein CTZ24_12245 [Pantoea phytobeneficialis]
MVSEKCEQQMTEERLQRSEQEQVQMRIVPTMAASSVIKGVDNYQGRNNVIFFLPEQPATRNFRIAITY